MLFLSSRPYSSRQSFTATNSAWPVLSLIGMRPKKAVVTFSSISLKYRATRTKCFSVVQSVDSSAMIEKTFLFISCTRSSLRAGETTFVIILVHFVLCNLSFFSSDIDSSLPSPSPHISPTWSTVGIAEWYAIHTAKHISAYLISLEIVGIFIVNTGLVELWAVSLPVRSFPSACFTRTDFLGRSVFLHSMKKNASWLSPVAYLRQEKSFSHSEWYLHPSS